jgi:hypothetical protein
MKCCDTRRATQDLSDLLFANGQLRVHQRSAQRYILAPACGTTESFPVNHTYNAQQIEWFKAGGALNIIRKQMAS